MQHARKIHADILPRQLSLILLVIISFNVIATVDSHNPHTPQAYKLCEWMKFYDNCTATVLESRNQFTENDTFCEGGYSSFVCWQDSSPGYINSPCWSFDNTTITSKQALRVCLDDGTWYTEYNDLLGREAIWEHLDECSFITDVGNDEQGDMSKLLRNFKIAYTCGYAVSLVCLAAAIVIFSYFRKLHCTRTYIHLNLMVSFILRYSSNIVRDAILQSGYNAERALDNATTTDIANFCLDYEAGWTLTKCRTAVVLANYAIISNYFWLLVEGLYLQMLLGLYMLVEEKCFKYFMLFAWGGPWIVMSLWIYLISTGGELGCWEAAHEDRFVWTLKAPVLVSIIINFVIFVNIIRIIVSKLRQHNMNKSDTKFRLAKSTLALIPLLGIHFILFDILSQQGNNMSPTASNVIDCIRLVFLSIQGTLVTIFYCFMNGEVKTALKEWQRIRNWKKSLPSGTRNRSESLCYPQNGNSHTSVTYFSSKKCSADEKEVEILTPSANGCNELSVSYYISDNNGNSQRSSEVFIKTPQQLSLSDCEMSTDKSTSALLPFNDNNSTHMT